MKIDKEQLDRIIIFVKKQWKPVSLAILILVSLIITLTIPGDRKNNLDTHPGAGGKLRNNNTSKNSPTPTEKPSNPFKFLFGNEDEKISPTVAITPPAFPQNVVTESTQKSTITKISSDGTTTTETVSAGSALKTSQGTIDTNINVGETTGSEEEDYIAIIFQNPDGTTTNYIPPGTPPDEVRWARYINEVGDYEINYPFNWQFVYSADSNGHEGIALYPPGVNKNDPNAPFIGFGITQSLLLPTADNKTKVLKTPIQVDGIPGELYTNGPLGASYIASVFTYNSNYFGLGGSKSDVTFAYVYYFMIHSLTFNTE